MREAERQPAVMIDCSHANSGSDFRRQEAVWQTVLGYMVEEPLPIIGMMLESNLFEGKQPLVADRSMLRYGVSLTDGCVGWDTTERLLHEAHLALSRR